MTVPAEIIRKLHRIHRQLTDLRERTARGPRQIRAAEVNVAQAEEGVKQAKEQAKKAKIAVDEKQLQLRQRESRIADLQGKLNACSSNREYQALKEQIAADQQANAVLEDEILEALEDLDQLQKAIVESERRLQACKDELVKVRQRVSEEQSGLESELARVTAGLEEVEAELPADFRAEYERMVKARGEEAMAQVEDGFCGGCHHRLTPQMLNELYLQRAIVCKSCGCLLYLPESAKP